MRNGIAVAGSIYVDTLYNVCEYPNIGDLTEIIGPKKTFTGGAVSNVSMDLANIDNNLDVKVFAIIGDDELGKFVLSEFAKHPSIDVAQLQIQNTTGYTIAISDEKTKQRTFLSEKGNNTLFTLSDSILENLNVKILHLAYLLVLDELDKKDDEYGTKAARLLAKAQSLGIETSIDLVSKNPSVFKDIVIPSLKYSDYCIINEIEAQRTTDIILRDGDNLVKENIKKCLFALKDLGVSKWAVIHCPEGGYGLDQNNNYYEDLSIELPKNFIKSKVGAGDAFCAGVLYASHQGFDLKYALRLGSAVAACCLSSETTSYGVLNYQECLKCYDGFIQKTK